MNTNWVPSLSSFDGPKYKALAAALKDGIAQGALPPGRRLPPVRELAYQLDVTPGTVARAYSVLTDAGVLSATVGRGTFVADISGPWGDDVGGRIEEDAIPHGTGNEVTEANFYSPALPDVGQAALIRSLMAQVANDPPSGLMHYPTRAGFKPAREAVKSWLAGTPLGALDQEDIVLSHGGQNGICLALQTLIKGARPVILVEELAYPGFRRAAELLRAEVLPVPMDSEGIIPEALDHAVRSSGAQVLCTSPEVHNPTGLFTPETRRREIAQIATARGLHIVEDDCYRMGTARAPTYRMLVPDLGWYVSSISKTLTPALRIGFVAAPKLRAADLRRSAEHGFFGLATPLADLAALLLAHRDIDRLAVAVTTRLGAYIEVLVNHLGSYDISWRRDVPFVWVTMPSGWRASSFVRAAAEQGIKLRSAEDFADRDGRFPHAVRIAINAQLSIDRFEAAMMAVRNLLDNPPERIGV